MAASRMTAPVVSVTRPVNVPLLPGSMPVSGMAKSNKKVKNGKRLMMVSSSSRRFWSTSWNSLSGWSQIGP
jgi:hypothetical protein